MTRPHGIILAGGLATRMGGGDKCLLPLGDARVLDHVIDRIAPQVAELALNANGDAIRFADTLQMVLPDTIPGFAGPLAGVLAGLDWAAEQGASHVVSVAADTPFFPRDLVVRLQRAVDADHPIALAATPHPDRGKTRHPTFGLWPVALRDDLRQALQDGLRKVVLWTDRHGTATVIFDAGPSDPFFNINTPADLDHARQMLAEGV